MNKLVEVGLVFRSEGKLIAQYLSYVSYFVSKYDTYDRGLSIKNYRFTKKSLSGSSECQREAQSRHTRSQPFLQNTA